MRATLIVLLVIFLWASVYFAANGTVVASEIRTLHATLAELEESPRPEAHPYFWFCPEPGECAAEEGYVAWYSAHGGS